ncbi:hypothetical protein NliqN6_2145 [Naganishia liquefaciens]|uniref:WSC domain-containing protein n=1 Tax=Naganishia liquefaciens TaxID=104408 RepID=A0A8H3TRU2_9TREE|nr:hypothetical protein NliqN6_2145 [Naganishia liquefaciens]
MVLVSKIFALSLLSLLAQAAPSPTTRPDTALAQAHILSGSDVETTSLHHFQKRQTCYTFFFFWRWCFADDDTRDVVTTTFGGQAATVTLRTVSTTSSNPIRSTAVSTRVSSSSRLGSSTPTTVTSSTGVGTSLTRATSSLLPSSSAVPTSASTASASRASSSLVATSSGASSSSVASSASSGLGSSSSISSAPTTTVSIATSAVSSVPTSTGSSRSTISSDVSSTQSSVEATSPSVSTLSSTVRFTSSETEIVSSAAPTSSDVETSSSVAATTSDVESATSEIVSVTPTTTSDVEFATSEIISATTFSEPSSTGSTSPIATPSSKWAQPVLPNGWALVNECMAEGTTGRALTGSTYLSDAMTIELCITYCNSNGFPLAGLEYSTECYCGTEYSNGADPSISSSCDMPCSGNEQQLCAGANALSVYRNDLYVAPVLSLPNGWAAADPLCIQEVPGRALTGASYAADDMTVDSCVAYCDGLGFPFAAVEYGRECFCGTQLVNGASFDKPSRSCSMACAGSTAENRQMCGGPGAMNVYFARDYVTKIVAPPGWESLGCIAEGTQGRALVSAELQSDSMTIDMCLNFCSSRGFGMAGLEYGRECYCAKDSLSNGASLAVTSNQWYESVYMPCAGSILTPCGGSYALDLWLNKNVATAVNEVASAVGKWKDTGLCLQEVEGRALRGAAVSTPGMTVEYCLNYCGGLGFLMAGVEYGSECYCGQSLEGGANVGLQSGECKMPCAGNTEQICGGPNGINYYTTDTLDITVKLPTGWSKIGCVAEPQGHRALNVSAFDVSPIQGSFMTGVACARACADAGYELAGTQYSTECRCGHVLDVPSLVVLDDQSWYVSPSDMTQAASS